MKRLACVVLLVAAGCGASPSTPAASIATMPVPFDRENLPNVVVTRGTVPPDMTVDDELSGRLALEQPVLLLERTTFGASAGFVDARMTRLGTSGPGSYWEEGGYVSWAALYESEAAATVAFGILLAEHESPDGWGMDRIDGPSLGDQGTSLSGPAYGFDTTLHMWRVGNLLLAAAGLGTEATAEELSSIAYDMDRRAGGAEAP